MILHQYTYPDVRIFSSLGLTSQTHADSVAVVPEELEDTLTRVKMAINPTMFILSPSILGNKALIEILLIGIDGTPDFYPYTVSKSSN